MSTTVTWLAVALCLTALQWRRRNRLAASRRRDRMEAGLGRTVDLIAVVIGSGGTIYQAVSTVARHGPDLVRPVFDAVLQDAAAGELLGDALTGATEALGPPYHPLLGALVATERDGAPASALLHRLADDAQLARRWQLESLAGRLPVTLLVPLVTCLLPAVILGAVVPLAVVAIRQLNL